MEKGTSNTETSGTGGTDPSTTFHTEFLVTKPPLQKDERLKTHTQNSKPKKEKTLDPVAKENSARRDINYIP